MTPIELKLATPIQAGGQTVTTLTFRPMTARDLRQCGCPMSTAFETRNEIRTEPTHALISALAGIPPSSVDQLAPEDFMAAFWVIASFLVGATPKASSPAPTN